MGQQRVCLKKRNLLLISQSIQENVYEKGGKKKKTMTKIITAGCICAAVAVSAAVGYVIAGYSLLGEEDTADQPQENAVILSEEENGTDSFAQDTVFDTEDVQEDFIQDSVPDLEEEETKPARQPAWQIAEEQGGTGEEIAVAYAEELGGFLQEAIALGRNGSNGTESACKDFLKELSDVYAGDSHERTRLPEYTMAYTMFCFAKNLYSDDYQKNVIANCTDYAESVPEITAYMRESLENSKVDVMPWTGADDYHLNKFKDDESDVMWDYIGDWDVSYDELFQFIIEVSYPNMYGDTDSGIRIFADVMDTNYGPMLGSIQLDEEFSCLMEGKLDNKLLSRWEIKDIVSRYYISSSSSVASSTNWDGVGDYDNIFHQAEIWCAMGAFVSKNQYLSYCSDHPEHERIYSVMEMAQIQYDQEREEYFAEINETMNRLLEPVDAYIASAVGDMDAKLELYDAILDGSVADYFSAAFNDKKSTMENRVNIVSNVINEALSADDENVKDAVWDGLVHWWD